VTCVFGTFNFLHRGHINYFEQAGENLTVFLTDDDYSESVVSFSNRRKVLEAVERVDKVVKLSSEPDEMIEQLKAFQPEEVVFGYDHEEYAERMSKALSCDVRTADKKFDLSCTSICGMYE